MNHELAVQGHSQLQSAAQPDGDDWLSPQAALERFAAPADLLWSGAQEALERNRYGYRVGVLHLLIALDTDSEVLRQPAISSLPGSAPWLLGMMNLRGNLVPVFDLRQLLGAAAGATAAPSAQDKNALVLVLGKGDHALGVLVDSFPQPLTKLSPVTRMPQLPKQLQAHVGSAFFKDDSIWLDFQHQSFFEQLSRNHAFAA